MSKSKENINREVEQAFNLIENNQIDGAQQVLQALLALDINDSQNLLELCRLSSKLGESNYVINILTKLVGNYPGVAEYIDKLAQAYLDNSMFRQAETFSKKAIEIDSQHASAYIRLGFIMTSENRFNEAVEYLKKAIKLKPNEPAIYNNLILSLKYVDRHDETLELAKKLIQLQPDNANSHQVMGRVLAELGQFEEAKKYFHKAIQINKSYALAYYNLSNINKFTEKDSDFICKIENILQESMTPSNRSLMHFTLGKIYNDIKNWDKAFENYKQGNTLNNKSLKSDAAQKLFKLYKKLYTKKYFEELQSVSDSKIPVFIIGMPRSGTSLIEQIISSHPEVGGVGEHNEINIIDVQIIPNIDISVNEIKKQLRDAPLKEYADQYLKVLCNSRRASSRVVNKMPDNYLQLGLIHALFPNAYIIHAIRNPLDTCLSCYFQNFTHVDWSFDLELIGNQYRFYRKVMDHWKKILPENKILDIHYEQLVDNPESQIRKIIDYLNLPWSDVCLEHHESEKIITTASFWQARQAIYSSSRRRWLHYTKYIQPLAKQLVDYLNDDDIAEFEKMGMPIKKKYIFF